MNIWGWLTGASASGVSDLVSSIGTSAINIRSAITGELTPEGKAQVLAELAKIDDAQIALDQATANSPSMFIAGWRPAAGWLGVFGLAYATVIQPIGTWVSLIFHGPSMPLIDTGALITVLLTMMGIGGMRSYEKSIGVDTKH